MVGKTTASKLYHSDYITVDNFPQPSMLTWDENAARYTRDYATRRVGDCRLLPSGENLAWSSGDLSGTEEDRTEKTGSSHNKYAGWF